MLPKSSIVIVVDDNASFLKGVARLLALDGIDARTFGSAEALIESGTAQTASCLLLDIHLGGISGIELYRRLAASGWKCPVIFMTASDEVATHHEAGTAGASPIYASRSHGKPCGTPLGKYWRKGAALRLDSQARAVVERSSTGCAPLVS